MGVIRIRNWNVAVILEIMIKIKIDQRCPNTGDGLFNELTVLLIDMNWTHKGREMLGSQ